MRSPAPRLRVLLPLIAVVALALPTAALGAPRAQPAAKPQKSARAPGTLVQLPGPGGCVVDRSVTRSTCARARALDEPAPVLGSRAVALSPDGRNLYVAAAGSDAIAVFARNARTGRLTQPRGAAGCIAAQGANGCATAIPFDGPNSVAVSPDGRNVYATSVGSEAVTVFDRNLKTGALTQHVGGGSCFAAVALPGCTVGRGLLGPDVVVVSPDGHNVYVGSFFGNAVAVFNRDPAGGALTQPSDASGCLVQTATANCTTALALGSIEGMAISPDGTSLLLGAAVSQALVVLARNPASGALTQAGDGSGCIVAVPLTGCTNGTELNGADAVAVSPDSGDVYVTAAFSKTVIAFTRSRASGLVTQKQGPSGCVVLLRANGCAFGRALNIPEGLTVSPDGRNVYSASYLPGTIAALARDRRSGAIAQLPRKAGCVGSVPDCTPARGLSGVGSLVVSPDGRYLYAAAAKSDAVTVFRRITRQPRHG